MGIVDVAQGYSYAQRYRRKVAALGSTQQYSGMHTLSSSSCGLTANTSSTDFTSVASSGVTSYDSSHGSSRLISRQDNVQHLARLTQQLSNSISCNSYNSLSNVPGADAHHTSQSRSVNNARSRCSQHASLPLAEVQNQVHHQSKHQPVRHKHGASKAAVVSRNTMAQGPAGSQAPYQQECPISADAHMATAVQQSRAAASSSVAEAAAKSASVARLASTTAQADATSASSAAQPVHTLPAKVLPTSHVVPCMSPAASASGLSAAELASQHAAAETAPLPAAAETAARHAANESASLDPAACAMAKPQGTATGSMPEADTGCSARAGLVQEDMPRTTALMQTDIPLTKALVQIHTPLTTALVQRDMPLTKALVQRDMPLTKALVQSSGTGCEDILEMIEAVSRVRQREIWVTRSFRGNVQSSCTLQLQSKAQHGVSIKVAFQDAASTPVEVAFAQTASLSRAWQQLGSMQLKRDDRQQLQHVFRLGAQHSIKRYLRISFSGHLLVCTSGLHSVRKLSVTAPAWVPCSGSASDSESNSATAATSGLCCAQASRQRLKQGGAVPRCKAEPSLQGQGFGRELYVAGTAEAVTLSVTSAASSMPGGSAVRSVNRWALDSEGDSDAAVMVSASCEAESKLVGQACSADAQQEVPLDLASVDQVSFDFS